MLNLPIRSIRVALIPHGDASSLAAEPSSWLDAPERPRIDIHEGPDGLVLEADLPGTSADSLTVQVEENVLSLSARPTMSRLPEGTRAIYEESRTIEFRRSFILSDEVDRERISAELRDGVLRVLLPKSDRARTRKIEVKSS